MELVSLILTALLYSLVVHIQAADEGYGCLTPDLKEGRCIDVKSCKVIIDAIRTGNQEAMFFAKKSQCSVYEEGKFPNVCCGPESTLNATVLQHELLPKHTVCGLEALYDGYPVGLGAYGGTEALFSQFPWMVLLKYKEAENEKFSCGGSLISRRYVLTAAHCTKLPPRLSRKLIGVRLGEHKISTPVDCRTTNVGTMCTEAPVDLAIEQVINHPGYSSRNWNDDISLLRLERDVQFTKYIRPICLPEDDSNFPSNVILAGWGETEFSAYSDVKIIVGFPVVNSSECEVKLGKKLQDKQFCAGGEDNKDSCNGDSGGPLVSHNTKVSFEQKIQYGIVSHGLSDCGIQGVPAIYTRVGSYLDWIVSNLSE